MPVRRLLILSLVKIWLKGIKIVCITIFSITEVVGTTKSIVALSNAKYDNSASCARGLTDQHKKLIDKLEKNVIQWYQCSNLQPPMFDYTPFGCNYFVIRQSRNSQMETRENVDTMDIFLKIHLFLGH